VCYFVRISVLGFTAVATFPSTKRIGDQFELLVSIYYEALGYKVTRDVRIGGHQIDLMASKQISGAGLFTIMVEAKSSTETVGINEVTPFLNTAGDLLRNAKIQQAICITDSKFSQDAKSAVFGKTISSITRNRSSKLCTIMSQSRFSKIFSNSKDAIKDVAKRQPCLM
jgi:hypothetical protein